MYITIQKTIGPAPRIFILQFFENEFCNSNMCARRIRALLPVESRFLCVTINPISHKNLLS